MLHGEETACPDCGIATTYDDIALGEHCPVCVMAECDCTGARLCDEHSVSRYDAILMEMPINERYA